MERNDEILGFLGLLYKAHEALIGEELLHHLDSIHLLIASKGLTSGESRKTLEKAKRMEMKVITLFEQEELGNALGKAQVAFVGIKSKKASIALLKKLGTEGKA